MTISVDDLRQAFPEPSALTHEALNDPRSTDYCVGGSLCLYFQKNFARFFSPTFLDYYFNWSGKRFPAGDSLVMALQWANPQLSNERALHFAREIIHYNERREFEDAWAWMAKALEFTP